MNLKSRYFQYFIGIDLPEEETGFFTYLKKQFRPDGANVTPAHITIVPPFFYKDESILIPKLELWAQEQKSFVTKFEEVGTFWQPKYGTVYLAPNDDVDLKNIFVSLNKAVPYLLKKQDKNFVPHLTVANRIPLDEVQIIKNQLSSMMIKLELKVRYLVIFKKDLQGDWQKSILLKFGK